MSIKNNKNKNVDGDVDEFLQVLASQIEETNRIIWDTPKQFLVSKITPDGVSEPYGTPIFSCRGVDLSDKTRTPRDFSFLAPASLKTQLAKIDPKPGDFLRIVYSGKKMHEGRSYHSFFVEKILAA